MSLDVSVTWHNMAEGYEIARSLPLGMIAAAKVGCLRSSSDDPEEWREAIVALFRHVKSDASGNNWISAEMLAAALPDALEWLEDVDDAQYYIQSLQTFVETCQEQEALSGQPLRVSWAV